MDISENNDGQEFLSEMHIPLFQEFDFDPKLKDVLTGLFEKIGLLSKEFFQSYYSGTTENISEINENSFNNLKDILSKTVEFSEKDYKESDNCFESYFSNSLLLVNKIEDFALNNSKIWKDMLNTYLTEFSKIIEEIPENLYIGYSNNISSQTILNDSNLSNTKTGIFISEENVPIDPSLVKFRLFSKVKFPQIIRSCFGDLIEASDTFYYQNFAKLNLINQLPASCLPSKESGFISFLKAFKVQSDKLYQIFTSLNGHFDFKEPKFENYLMGLKLKYDSKIEDLFCGQINHLNTSEFLAQNEVEINLFQNFNELINEVFKKSQLVSQAFFNEIKFEIHIEKSRVKLYQIVQMLYLQLEQIIKMSLDVKNEKLIFDIKAAIENYTHNKKNNIENSFRTDDDTEITVYSDLEKTIDASLLAIKNQIRTIPAFIELIKDVIFTDFKLGNIKESQSYKILVNKILDGIVGVELIPVMQMLPLSISKSINEIETEILNQNRLIKYSILSNENQQINQIFDNEEIDVLKFLNQKMSEAEQNKIKIEQINNLLLNDLVNAFYATNEKLNLSYFRNEANTFLQYIPKKKIFKGILVLKKITKQISVLFDKLADKFWSQQSNALIIAEDLLGKQTFDSTVYHLINRLEHLTVNEKVLAELPFYYKHLFIDSTYFNPEFWIGRKKELERAQIAHERFQNGIAGSLMITGDRFSGKSSMVRYLCSEIFQPVKTIIIDAPVSGLVDSKLLLKKIQEQSGIKGDFAKIFTMLEPGTTVVFEDIELWWEKSENGNKVITQVFEILESYNQNVFFIITMNSNSFIAVEKMIKFQLLFLDIISCKPINSKSIQEIILFRHRISGIKFELKHGITLSGRKTEETFKPKNFANLFSKYFNYSGGNIGACLLAWISNIDKLDGSRIIMELPKSSEIPELKNLEKDDILLLYQFLIHKKMDIAKISRVLLQPENMVQRQLDFFKRSGIVVLKNNVYEINPYVNHIISAFLKKQNML